MHRRGFLAAIGVVMVGRRASAKPPRPTLAARSGLTVFVSLPAPIAAMCVVQDRLFVATEAGMFEVSPDGSSRSLRSFRAG